MGWKKEQWRHLAALAGIIIVGLLHIGSFVQGGKLPVLDTFSGYYPRAETLRVSILEYGDFFPLWQPFLMGGMPYLDASSYDIFSYIGILNLILPDAFLAVGWSYVLAYLMVGVSMYLLAAYLFQDRKAALVTGLVGMLSGYTTTRFGEGGAQLYAFSILPLAFLFLVKAFREKDGMRNAVYSGLLVAVQIKFSPAMRVTMFASLLFALYLGFQLIGNGLKSRAMKAGKVGLVLVLVIFGLTAHYLLPQKALIDSSSRSALSFEESSRRQTPFLGLFPLMVEPLHKDLFRVRYADEGSRGMGFKIGIVAFLLAAYGVYRNPRNKMVLFLLATILLAISIATASWVFWLLWKYVPPWDSFRYVNRAFVLWSFAGALLAGFGMMSLGKDLRGRWNLPERKAALFSAGMILLIILNLAVFVRHPIQPLGPRCNLYDLLPGAEALSYAKQVQEESGERFRVHDLETNGIDWPTDPYTTALGLEHIFGYTGAWDVEYMNQYLSLAYRSPAKFWGVLNVKYLTSRKPVELEGFRLVKEFDRFESDGRCPPPNASTWNDPDADAGMKAFGNYLYENERYLPRAYVVNRSVLVVGEHEQVLNAVYALMLDERFDPSTVVIVHGKGSVNDYALEELGRYSAVFLTQGSIDQRSGTVLQSYAGRGGMLIPNVLEGESQVSDESISRALEGGHRLSVRAQMEEVSMERKRVEVEAPVSGFLVLSERWAMFPGWSSEKEILRANGVISAVRLDGETGISFRYVPRYYRLGSWISIISLVGVGGYLIGGLIRKKEKDKEEGVPDA